MLTAQDAYLGSGYLWEDNSYNKQVVVFDWTFTLQLLWGKVVFQGDLELIFWLFLFIKESSPFSQ